MDQLQAIQSLDEAVRQLAETVAAGQSAPALLTVAQVAQSLQISEEMVRDLIHHRRLAYVPVGRHYRVRPAAVEDYVAKFERRAVEAGAGKAKR